MDDFYKYFAVGEDAASKTDLFRDFLVEAGDFVENCFGLVNDYIFDCFIEEKDTNTTDYMSIDFTTNTWDMVTEQKKKVEMLSNDAMVTRQPFVKTFTKMILSKYSMYEYVGPTIIRNFYALFSPMCSHFTTITVQPSEFPKYIVLWFEPSFLEVFLANRVYRENLTHPHIQLECLSRPSQIFVISPNKWHKNRTPICDDTAEDDDSADETDTDNSDYYDDYNTV